MASEIFVVQEATSSKSIESSSSGSIMDHGIKASSTLYVLWFSNQDAQSAAVCALHPTTSVCVLHPVTTYSILHPAKALCALHPGTTVCALYPATTHSILHPAKALCALYPATAVCAVHPATTHSILHPAKALCALYPTTAVCAAASRSPLLIAATLVNESISTGRAAERLNSIPGAARHSRNAIFT
ncbi:hypothetical protein N1851_027269 [Merluccius polli]|uniref:Uncharacterized protein n=1 Tax=Merluccius polli TaxID=89951 RepID=A0AA47MAH7_MERPO|nr:hypothetical protein N1851_027269 [Merluccius polli]